MKQFLHFWELPDKCKVLLDIKFWNCIYSFKEKKSLGWDKFSKLVNINRGTLKNYLPKRNLTNKVQYISLTNLKKIYKIIKMPMKEVESYIKQIKYGHGKPIYTKFPIDFLTEEWAGLVGALLSEGYLSKYNDIQFWSADKEIGDKFEEIVNKISPNIRCLRKSKGYYYCNLPRIFGQILITGLGFKGGAKLYTNPGIPFLYLNLSIKNKKNKKIISNLLSWLFTGDGWVSLFNNCNNETCRHMGIGFSIFHGKGIPKLLLDTRCLLIKFGIVPQKPFFTGTKEYIHKNKKIKSDAWKFFIHGKDNFELFLKEINFKDKRRKNILNKSTKSFVVPYRRNNESLINTLKIIIENPESDKYKICSKTNLTKKRIEILLKKAKDAEYVCVIDKNYMGINGKKLPFKYNSTEKGILFVNRSDRV